MPSTNMNQYISEDLYLTDEERTDLEDIQITGSAITFRNQDFDVAGLVKRYEQGDIIVPRISNKTQAAQDIEMNSFQRGFVWNKKQMDSFIESLLLEYPVPGFFFVQQNDRRLIVLDGQQRLETLRRFYSGFNGEKKYRLGLPKSRFADMTYAELPDRYRRILDDTYITTTVIILDGAPDSYEVVYDVFARLNSGGTQLTPHEIRMALYNGALMSKIDEINTSDAWRKLYGTEMPNKRFRDHELILRILALYLNSDKYTKPLGAFLNRFSEEYRDGESDNLLVAISLFEQTAAVLSDTCSAPFSLPGKSQVNTARADSIMCAFMDAISRGRHFAKEDVVACIDAINNCEEYEEATTSNTSDEKQVSKRLDLAKEIVNQCAR